MLLPQPEEYGVTMTMTMTMTKVDPLLLDAEERRAEKNTAILIRMAGELSRIPRSDPRYPAARLLLTEETKREAARAERLLSMQYAAEMAE